MMSSTAAALLSFLIVTACAQSKGRPSSKGANGRPSSESYSEEPEDDGQVGCNYVNVGGVGMPVDYCSRITYKGAYMSMIWTCNETYTGIDLAMYYSKDCSDTPLFTMDYTPYIPGFQCQRSLHSSKCNEVSLNAFEDENCDGDDFSEVRLITDECILYEDSLYMEMTCDGNNARYSVYDSWTAECSDETFVNSSKLEHGSIDGEDAGCIELEGCDDSDQALELLTNHGKTSQIVGYVMATIVTIAFIGIAVVLTMRYRQRKLEQETLAAVSLSHSEKEVPNPYGQLHSVDGPSTPKKEPMLKDEDRAQGNLAVV